MCKQLSFKKKAFFSEVKMSRSEYGIILIMTACFLGVLPKLEFQPNLPGFMKRFNFNWTPFSKGYHNFSPSVSFWASEVGFGIAQREPLSLFLLFS